MWNKKTFAALLSLALAGSMAVPAAASEFISIRPIHSEWAPVRSEYTPIIADENPLTRAELISVLYEKEGKPVVNFAMNYSDVSPDAEYAEAIRWASSEGIASGYSNRMFGPNDAVTREQMAVILYQYAQSKDQGFTGAWAFPLHYSDADQISEFAYEAVCWVTMKNIMGDNDNNTFAPRNEVTHQDADSMLGPYLNSTEQLEISNPFLFCATIQEAAQVAGFSMELPASLPQWARSSTIHAIESSMIEVVYQGEEEQLTLRKAVGTQEISGDYNVYPVTSTEKIGGFTAVLRGDADRVMVASWSSGGYTYAVRSTEGLEHDTMISILLDLK